MKALLVLLLVSCGPMQEDSMAGARPPIPGGRSLRGGALTAQEQRRNTQVLGDRTAIPDARLSPAFATIDPDVAVTGTITVTPGAVNFSRLHNPDFDVPVGTIDVFHGRDSLGATETVVGLYEMVELNGNFVLRLIPESVTSSVDLSSTQMLFPQSLTLLGTSVYVVGFAASDASLDDAYAVPPGLLGARRTAATTYSPSTGLPTSVRLGSVSFQSRLSSVPSLISETTIALHRVLAIASPFPQNPMSAMIY